MCDRRVDACIREVGQLEATLDALKESLAVCRQPAGIDAVVRRQLDCSATVDGTAADATPLFHSPLQLALQSRGLLPTFPGIIDFLGRYDCGEAAPSSLLRVEGPHARHLQLQQLELWEEIDIVKKRLKAARVQLDQATLAAPALANLHTVLQAFSDGRRPDSIKGEATRCAVRAVRCDVADSLVRAPLGDLGQAFWNHWHPTGATSFNC
jgi:hypothetical protein